MGRDGSGRSAESCSGGRGDGDAELDVEDDDGSSTRRRFQPKTPPMREKKEREALPDASACRDASSLAAAVCCGPGDLDRGVRTLLSGEVA
jgi:hypothetical protein